MTTTSDLYPNLYVFLVGQPGVGKTRAIRAVKAYLQELPEFNFAPTSMTGASLVDSLLASKRVVVRYPPPPLEYNTMMITAEELSAFIHKWDDQMVGLLSHYYDVDVYVETRRTKDLNIKIKFPQLNILTATTPSALMKLIPDFAWEQGFTSRTFMIYSNERQLIDDFAGPGIGINQDMIHDLKSINALVGRVEVTPEWSKAIMDWRQLGEPPVPKHPKLIHYATRRKTHMYKLSIVASVDRGDDLKLTVADFNRAMGWLVEAEAQMRTIFEVGASGEDGKMMEEIYHFILVGGGQKGLPYHKIVNYARERVPAHRVVSVIEIMDQSGMIQWVANDERTSQKIYKAVPK